MENMIMVHPHKSSINPQEISPLFHADEPLRRQQDLTEIVHDGFFDVIGTSHYHDDRMDVLAEEQRKAFSIGPAPD